MRKLMTSVVPFLLLILLAFNIAGCGSTPFTPLTPTPTPMPEPTPAAKAPMGAFIEDYGAAPTRNIYTATNDGTGLTKVGLLPRNFHSVYVLSDGSKAVFAAQAGDGYSQIYYLAPVDSPTAAVQLTTTPLHKTGAMLSADGSKIAFLQLNPVQNDPDGRLLWDVAVMDANGSNLYVIPRPQGWYVSHPFLSPDGSTIAVALDEGFFGGDMGIFTMNTDGTDLKRLTPGGADGILALTPAFSPDGKQVAFGSIAWDDVSIYIINTDGSAVKRIGQQNSRWGDPLFVADRIMFVYQDQIYSMKSDGTDVKRITNNIYKDGFEFSIN